MRAALLGPLLGLALSCAPRAPAPGTAPAAPSPSPPPKPARPATWIPDGAFVRAAGTDLVIGGPGGGGQRFTFLGANFDCIHEPLNRARCREVLAALSQDGMTVGRQWAVGEGTAEAPEQARRYNFFRIGPDGWVEDTYRQLDVTLAIARELGIRLIITLSNHWKDYGGIPTYLRWAGLPSDGLAWEAFYSNEEVRAAYRSGVARLLSRTNTVTGARYVDDPAIFAWELMNESSILTSQGAAARRAWIAEMARFIKARDGNHMVSAGLLGYAMRAERAEWVAVHRMPEIDYCDSHLYPQDEGQVDSWERLRDFLDDRAQLARFVIGKPLLIGEFGFRTDGPPAWLGLPRAEWFSRLVERTLDNGAAGALVWIYEPFSGTPRNYGIYADRADTDDVRQALRRAAPVPGKAQARTPNPRLSKEGGDALLYEPEIRLVGAAAAHDRWRPAAGGRELLISPEAFAEARFERAGSWAGGPILHAYGANVGRFTYRFQAPPGGAPGALQIEARLSSEWPGAASPPDGGSPVRVLLDGVEVARLVAMPDDGKGRVEVVTVRERGALRGLAAGAHTLTFEVPDEPGAHGLCIYGTLTGVAPAPEGEFGPIRLRALSRAPRPSPSGPR
jgi:mannan endo-1,4-beta-mannosidase